MKGWLWHNHNGTMQNVCYVLELICKAKFRNPEFGHWVSKSQMCKNMFDNAKSNYTYMEFWTCFENIKNNWE